MDEKVIESREYLMKLYKGVYPANSGVGRQALARIDDTLANLRIRNNNLQEQLNKYKEVVEEIREELKKNIFAITYDNDEKGKMLELYDNEIDELLQILDKIKE